MTEPFLDTNILLRHLLADLPDQARRATAFLKRVESGEIRVHTSDMVIFETVFTLERAYKTPKSQIRKWLLPIVELPGILLPGKRKFRNVFDLYVDLNLPFADAYHAVLMSQMQSSEIVSFDKDFDRVPGVIRQEPP